METHIRKYCNARLSRDEFYPVLGNLLRYQVRIRLRSGTDITGDIRSIYPNIVIIWGGTLTTAVRIDEIAAVEAFCDPCDDCHDLIRRDHLIRTPDNEWVCRDCHLSRYHPEGDKPGLLHSTPEAIGEEP